MRTRLQSRQERMVEAFRRARAAASRGPSSAQAAAHTAGAPGASAPDRPRRPCAAGGDRPRLLGALARHDLAARCCGHAGMRSPYAWLAGSWRQLFWLSCMAWRARTQDRADRAHGRCDQQQAIQCAPAVWQRLAAAGSSSLSRCAPGTVCSHT